MMTYIRFATHRSGDIYLTETTTERVILRAVGPCVRREDGLYSPDNIRLDREDVMRAWLDNAGADAVDDGAWLARELAS